MLLPCQKQIAIIFVFMKKNLIGGGHRLGILGGGQLGRMFIQEAISYDIQVHIMDTDESCPSYIIANSFTKGDITDYNDVIAFGEKLDVLTVEIENVNIEALYDLEKQGVTVYPQPRVLEIIKDKGLQKKFYSENNIPTASFIITEKSPNKNKIQESIPFVQKLRKGGYDGRGVTIVETVEDMDSIFEEASIIEELIAFSKELSVIVARNKSGETVVYPAVECEFNSVNLVEYLFSPADIDSDIERKAAEIAIDVINKIDMVGILAVELFLTEGGEILVNEIAPRPHNSGHHTIECNVTSQFEQHLRSVLDLPLGSTELTRYGVMINLLGNEGYNGLARYEGLNEVLKENDVHVHLYGKKMTKPFRKMGHITVASATMDKAKKIAESIKGKIKVVA